MLAPWKKSYDKPWQHIREQKHHFASKGLYSQSYAFTVVMYRYESWTIKKAEYWPIDAFELWYWKRHLRVPWTARRSSQSGSSVFLKSEFLKFVSFLKSCLFFASGLTIWQEHSPSHQQKIRLKTYWPH